MKIKNISNIQEYKSFKYFKNQNFNFNDRLNLFFGENGNGKSSIVDIFKNLSNQKEFEKKPEKILLKIDTKEFEFKNYSWKEKVEKDKFIFFDDDFIARNIHINKERETTQERQAQNSSKLLISFDEKAINLKKEEEEEKKNKKEKEKEIKTFKERNKILLDKNFEKFREKFNNFNQELNLENLKSESESLLSNKEKEKEILENNLNKINEIQKLELNSEKLFKQEINISKFENDLNKIKEIDVKENTINESQKNLADYISNNKDFFEKGFSIMEQRTENKKCPFCLIENRENELQKLLNLKNKIFDESYENQLKKFNNLKKEIMDFIDKETIDLSFQNFFNQIEKINKDFNIENLYKIEDKDNYQNITFQHKNIFLEEFRNINENNNKISNFQNLENFKKEIISLNKKIKNFNELVKNKNDLLEKFKNQNSDKTINEKLIEIQKITEKLRFEIEFLENFLEIKNFFDIKSTLNNLEEELKTVETNLNDKKFNYKKYWSNEIFKQNSEKMTEYLEKFNLNLKIEFLKKEGRHETMPFIFQVKDKENNLRSLKEGLSNGELQALSISFFFSFLDSQKLEDKVIFFDDPVSSLDNSNLKIFINILKEKIDTLNQIFIFTHHITFFKFLYKSFKDSHERFLLLKNKPELGGSFYRKFGTDSLFNKLEKFSENHFETLKNNNQINYEMLVLEYGQYLRYEVENFIKNDLLFWNKSANFSDIVDNLKKNSLEDQDIESIKEIYQFCNWTTSHVDINENTFLNALNEKIKNFVDIKNKINPSKQLKINK